MVSAALYHDIPDSRNLRTAGGPDAAMLMALSACWVTACHQRPWCLRHRISLFELAVQNI